MNRELTAPQGLQESDVLLFFFFPCFLLMGFSNGHVPACPTRMVYIYSRSCLGKPFGHFSRQEVVLSCMEQRAVFEGGFCFFFDALDSMRFHLWRLLTAANPSLCFRHGLGGHRHHCVVLACRVSVCILSCSNNFTQVRKSRL